MGKIKEIFVNICDKMKMSYLIIPNLFQSARCLLLTMFDILFLSFSIYRSRVQCVIGIRVETRKLLEDRA